MPASRLDVRFIGHATVLLDFPGVRVLTDPFLRSRLGPLQRHGPLPSPAALDGVDGRPHLARPRRSFRPRFAGVDPRATRSSSCPAVWARRRTVSGGGTSSRFSPVMRSGLASSRSPPFPPSTGSRRARRKPSRSASWSRPAWACISPATPDAFQACDALPVGWTLPCCRCGPGVRTLDPDISGPRSAAEVLRDIGPAVAVPIHWGTLYPRRLHRIWECPASRAGRPISDACSRARARRRRARAAAGRGDHDRVPLISRRAPSAEPRPPARAEPRRPRWRRAPSAERRAASRARLPCRAPRRVPGDNSCSVWVPDCREAVDSSPPAAFVAPGTTERARTGSKTAFMGVSGRLGQVSSTPTRRRRAGSADRFARASPATCLWCRIPTLQCRRSASAAR